MSSNSVPVIIGSKINRNNAGYVYEPNAARIQTVSVGSKEPDTITIGPPQFDIRGLGGGIFCSTSPANIGDSMFKYNTSTGSGGGVYAFGNLSSMDADYNSVVINNCLLYGNSAAIDGGAVQPLIILKSIFRTLPLPRIRL